MAANAGLQTPVNRIGIAANFIAGTRPVACLAAPGQVTNVPAPETNYDAT